MPQKQNPTAEGGSRVLWKSLDGASRESFSPSDYRTQHLVVVYGIRSDRAALIAAIAFGGGGNAS